VAVGEAEGGREHRRSDQGGLVGHRPTYGDDVKPEDLDVEDKEGGVI
jgi:hypothetical protein